MKFQFVLFLSLLFSFRAVCQVDYKDAKFIYVEETKSNYVYQQVNDQTVKLFQLDAEFQEINALTIEAELKKVTTHDFTFIDGQIELCLYGKLGGGGELFRLTPDLQQTLERIKVDSKQIKQLWKQAYADRDKALLTEGPFGPYYFRGSTRNKKMGKHHYRLFINKTYAQSALERYKGEAKLKAYELKEKKGVTSSYEQAWETTFNGLVAEEGRILKVTEDAIYGEFKAKDENDPFNRYLFKVSRLSGQLVYLKQVEWLDTENLLVGGNFYFDDQNDRIIFIGGTSPADDERELNRFKGSYSSSFFNAHSVVAVQMALNGEQLDNSSSHVLKKQPIFGTSEGTAYAIVTQLIDGDFYFGTKMIQTKNVSNQYSSSYLNLEKLTVLELTIPPTGEPKWNDYSELKEIKNKLKAAFADRNMALIYGMGFYIKDGRFLHPCSMGDGNSKTYGTIDLSQAKRVPTYLDGADALISEEVYAANQITFSPSGKHVLWVIETQKEGLLIHVEATK